MKNGPALPTAVEAAPDLRVVEDLIERGGFSLTRSARGDECVVQAIERAAAWLFERAMELRCPTP